MNLRKREYIEGETGSYIALSGNLALEEAMKLS